MVNAQVNRVARDVEKLGPVAATFLGFAGATGGLLAADITSRVMSMANIGAPNTALEWTLSAGAKMLVFFGLVWVAKQMSDRGMSFAYYSILGLGVGVLTVGVGGDLFKAANAANLPGFGGSAPSLSNPMDNSPPATPARSHPTPSPNGAAGRLPADVVKPPSATGGQSDPAQDWT